ncbi:unnamed protein product [Trifolium pratense]|uniref:Uncharacterized protein n=1 Tax=Trifolium pratense TaxID=57577 RepID=A0ACB0LRN6_TRIPR|nr:unnamed protein product [Trifolium pratense]
MLSSHCPFHFEGILDILLSLKLRLSGQIPESTKSIITPSPNFESCQAPMLGLRPRNLGEYVVSSFIGKSFMDEMYLVNFSELHVLLVIG